MYEIRHAWQKSGPYRGGQGWRYARPLPEMMHALFWLYLPCSFITSLYQ